MSPTPDLVTSPSLRSPSARRSHRGRARLLAVTMASALTGACAPPPLIDNGDMGPNGPSDVGENLDPRSVFDAQVLPILTQNCQVCHQTVQMSADIFLPKGDEYNSITTYRSGKFLTQDVGKSSLLTYPIGQPHPGNQFTTAQLALVRGWLENEMAVRGTKTQTPATPSVPLREGDFFISLERLTKDPLSKISFRARLMAGNLVNVSKVTVTAGPLADITFKKPAFILITQNGVQRDSGDALASNNLTVTHGQSVVLDPGNLFLTRVPGTARVALVFDSLTTTPVNPPPSNPGCKSPDNFNSGVRPLLSGCAAVCHNPKALNPAAALAAYAFDMSGVLDGADAAATATACARTLARINTAAPATSVVVLQVTPANQGGTPNHLYKVGSYADFRDAVSTWAMSEK